MGGGGRARVCAAGGRFRAQLQSTPCRPAASPPRPLLTTATAQHIRAAPTAAASHAGTRLPRETNEHHVRFSRAHSAPHLAAASASSNVASMRVGGQKLRARKQRLHEAKSDGSGARRPHLLTRCQPVHIGKARVEAAVGAAVSRRMWGATRRAGVGCTCLRIIAIMLPAPCSRSPHPVTYLQRDAKPSRSFAAAAP